MTKLNKLKSPTLLSRSPNEIRGSSATYDVTRPARAPPRPPGKAVFHLSPLLSYLASMDPRADDVPLTRVHISAQLHCIGNNVRFWTRVLCRRTICRENSSCDMLSC